MAGFARFGLHADKTRSSSLAAPHSKKPRSWTTTCSHPFGGAVDARIGKTAPHHHGASGLLRRSCLRAANPLDSTPNPVVTSLAAFAVLIFPLEERDAGVGKKANTGCY